MDENNKGDWANTIAIIDRMEKQGLIIAPLHDYMIGSDLVAIATASAIDCDWSGRYQTLQRLPPWYNIHWILDHSHAQGCTGIVNKATFAALERKHTIIL